MTRASASRWAKFLATLLVSIVFLYLFARDLDVGEVWRAIRHADYVYVAAGLLLFAASLVARAFRLRTLFTPNPPPMRLLGTTLLVVYAANNLLPLRGGEILRAQILFDKAGMSRMRTMGVALLERLLDLAVLGAFVVCGQFLVDVGIAFIGTGLLVAGGATAGLVAARLIVAQPSLTQRIVSIRWLPLKPSWRDTLRMWSGSVIEGLSALGSSRAFVAAAMWTGLAWGFEFGMYWLVATAFQIDEGFLTMAFVGAAASLSLSVPSAQGGVGPFQLVAKEALLKFGVATNVAAAYALALHVLLVLPVTIVGIGVFVGIIASKRGLSLLSRPAEGQVIPVDADGSTSHL